MIVGLGTDVASVGRFEETLARHGERLLARVFTADEVRYAQAMRRPGESLAARFAAKEACFKAIGVGWPQDGVRYQDVEVVRLGGGAPTLTLRGRIAELAAARGVTRTHVSLSHAAEVAMAVVLLETDAASAAEVE